jgi:uncharacterized protein YraI
MTVGLPYNQNKKGRAMKIKLFACMMLLVTGLFLTSSLYAQDEALYRVAFVTEDDTLNVRSGAGVGNPVQWQLAPDALDVQITGNGQSVGRSTWVPITQSDLSGWVNRYYLTEQVFSEAFCDDPAAQAVVTNLKTAISERDPVLLSALISPARGLLIRYSWWNPEVRLRASDVSDFFSGTRSYDWGTADGSGFDIAGSPAEVILPMLDADLLSGEIAGCNEVVGGPTAGMLELPYEYEAVNFLSVYRPAPDNFNEFDWGTWVVGIEYWGGVPYLSYLVHYEWEI